MKQSKSKQTKKSQLKQTLRSLLTARFLIGISVLSLFIIANAIWLSYQHFVQSPLKFDQQTTITISNGQSVNALAKKWQQQGVIANRLYMRLFTYLNPELSRIKTGEYALSQNETITSILTKLTQGVGIQYPFTIIEGMSSYEVLEKLKSTQFIEPDISLTVDYTNSQQARKANEKLLLELSQKLEIAKRLTRLNEAANVENIKATETKAASGSMNSAQPTKTIHSAQTIDSAQTIRTAHIEGWFYPDTYYFTKNEKASALLKRAVAKMQQVLIDEWQNRDRTLNLPYASPYDVLIMASIIEKETGIHSERSKIAGVFTRRLHKRMPLGTDPTIIYGIGPSFNGDITFKDLRTKTPYNTRLNKGLTPTPIAMPSRASIHAALNPDDGESLYFVADGSGGHYFSKTLKEHNQAVQRYLKLKK